MEQINNKKKASDAAFEFFRTKQKYEKIKEEFESRKNIFYDKMDEFFRDKRCSSEKFDIGMSDCSKLIVKRIENTTIEWNIDRLENKIDKSAAKKIIKKQYRVSDMKGLANYLKSCGVDPAVFKKFILIDKTVDEKEIERLSDTGHITASQIRGCYTVRLKKPYFTVSVKNDNNGEL